MAITDDSRYIFFGGRKFRIDDLGVVLGTVEDDILATNATGTVAVGRRHIWDGMTFTTLAALPAEATLAAMVDDGRRAYVYVDGTERLVEVDLAE